MCLFMSLFVVLQTSSTDVIVVPADRGSGVRITLQNTRSESGKQVVWRTTIMKLGEKLRIEETFPGSEEVGEVIIWDGKECKLFAPHHGPQVIPPIRNASEFLGFKPDVKEENVKWDVDKVTKVAVKKSTDRGVTNYEEYLLIEEFGQFPTVIEKYKGAKLVLRRELIRTEKRLSLGGVLFDPQKVEFSEEAKELAKKLYLQ